MPRGGFSRLCLYALCTLISRSIRLTFPTAQLVRNSRYQQLAEGIERTDRRELERHQMGFAEWQLLQHGVRSLSVGHIQDEDDTRPVFQRIPLVDLAIEIELRGLANLGRQNALNLRHVRARGEGADGQNLGGRRLRHRCLELWFLTFGLLSHSNLPIQARCSTPDSLP